MSILVLIARIKQIINHETLSGYFALLALLTATWNWVVACVMIGLAMVHWWNPQRKDKIKFD